MSLVFPRTKLLDPVDSDRTISLLQLMDAIRPDRHNFEGMLSNPAQSQINHPDFTAEDIVNLYESFSFWSPWRKSGEGGPLGRAYAMSLCLELFVLTA